MKKQQAQACEVFMLVLDTFLGSTKLIPSSLQKETATNVAVFLGKVIAMKKEMYCKRYSKMEAVDPILVCT